MIRATFEAGSIARNFFFGMYRHAISGLLALLSFLIDCCLRFLGSGRMGRGADSATEITKFSDKLRYIKEILLEEDKDRLVDISLSDPNRIVSFHAGTSVLNCSTEEVSRLISMVQTDRLHALYSGKPVVLRIGNEGRKVTIQDLLNMSGEKLKDLNAVQFLFPCYESSQVVTTSPVLTREKVNEIFPDRASSNRHLVSAWIEFLLLPLKIKIQPIEVMTDDGNTICCRYSLNLLNGEGWMEEGSDVEQDFLHYGYLITCMLETFKMSPAFGPKGLHHEFPIRFWEGLGERLRGSEKAKQFWGDTLISRWNPIMKQLGLEPIDLP